jgi:glycosyltransferase involved in cell wall biosynthesis
MTNLKQAKSFLFVLGFSCPFPGAAWNRISYLAKYFKDRGVACSILSTFFPLTIKRVYAEKMGISVAQNIRIYNMIPQIPVDNPFLLILNNFIAFIYSLPFCLLKRPDLLIISIWPANQLLCFFWISKILGIKLVVDYRDEVEDNWITSGQKPKFFYQIMRRVLIKIYRDSYLVTPTTLAVANRLGQEGVRNVHVVADGVDTTVFKPLDKAEMRNHLNIPKDTFVLVFLGYVNSLRDRNSGAYAVDIIIKALKLLKEKNKKNEDKYLFIMIGGGRVEEVLRCADSLGVTKMVRYVGLINDPIELVKIINVADVGIIPYSDSPTLKRMVPTKLYEYTACGLPVIGTVCEDSFLAEYLKIYSIGTAVPPYDGESLAKAVEDVSNVLKNKSELNSNVLSFARNYEKAKIAGELLSRLLKDD